MRFQPVPHFLADQRGRDHAAADGGGRFTYGADHAPTDELVEFARDTDLLLIEATLPRPERDGPARPHHRRRGRRARPPGGRAAARAHPHLRRAGREAGRREEAERAFGGPVEMAREGAVYDV